MFEEQRQQGSGEEEMAIAVTTRKGTPLPNYISPTPSFQQISFYSGLRAMHGQRWEERKPATGGYNCAGLVWASRRTCLYRPKDWRTVLVEDEYRKTEEPDVQVGDIAVYVRRSDLMTGQEPEILHVGRICFFRPHSVLSRTPWVISKWDPFYGEDIHEAYDCPQLCGGEPFTLEFWTDRPPTRPSVISFND